MMTNAYIIYLKVNEEYGLKKKDLLSHHDFQRAIALAWIGHDDNKLQLPSKRKRDGSVDDSISPLTIDFSVSTGRSGDKRRCARITDDALKPTGALCIRLDDTKDHLPDKAKQSARCSLHRYVGVETEKQVMYCATCNINLCVNCYRFFHKIPDPKSLTMAAKKK